MYGQGRELELGNAASAVLVSLLKTLVDKNILSNTEARVLLTKAANDLGPHEYAAPVKGAMGGSYSTTCSRYSPKTAVIDTHRRVDYRTAPFAKRLIGVSSQLVRMPRLVLADQWSMNVASLCERVGLRSFSSAFASI